MSIKDNVNSDHTYKPSTIISTKSDKPVADEKSHYVNNKAFYEAIVERKRLLKEAEENGTPPPKISNFIGECILAIANNLAKKYNFSGYTYKDEMIGDAVAHCLRYLDSFDTEVSNNPFSYFTQATYFQFIKRIKDEEKELYIKCKATLQATLNNNTAQIDEFKNDKTVNAHMDLDTQFMDNFIESFEEKERQKKASVKQKREDKELLNNPKTESVLKSTELELF